MESFQFDKIHLSTEVLNVIQNSTGDILETASNWVRNLLTGLINLVTSLPSIAICVGISVVALYFICVDKIYILDQIEHHLPKVWVRKIGKHLKDLIQTLRRISKSRSKPNFSIFYLIFNWIIYIRIYRLQCPISIINGIIYWFC